MSADSLEDDFQPKQKQKQKKERKRVSLDELGFTVSELPETDRKYSNLVHQLFQSREKPLVVKTHTKIKVLIVCAGALRAIEIIKQLKEGSQKLQICKLFARHLKVQEQIQMLKESTFQIDAIKLNKLEVVLVDVSHKDKKNLTITN
ncbi:hypothetical protein EDD86DRAFT_245590 [Gorgonomyces haynaldii]|nr:hypothetical protein EDD86DRAFT_245590 [Gorgonomyces haynaldii]